MPESAGSQLQFTVTRENRNSEGRIMSVCIDREIKRKRVYQSTAVSIASLKGVMLLDSPGTQQRRK